MSYSITRAKREVIYENDHEDRIDMYLYFGTLGPQVDSDGVRPEDLLSELIGFIESTMVSSVKSEPTQQAQALDEALSLLRSASKQISLSRQLGSDG